MRKPWRSIRTIHESLYWAGCDSDLNHGDLNLLHKHEATARARAAFSSRDKGDQAWTHDIYWALTSALGDIKQHGAVIFEPARLETLTLDSLAYCRGPRGVRIPANAGWQRDLSVSYNKVGGVQEAQGNLSGALKSYSRQPRHCRPPREIRPRQCGLAARSVGELQ